MDPTQLHVVQRRVQIARQELIKQKLAIASVPESFGELFGFCENRGLGQLVEFVPKRFAGITIIHDYRHCLVSRGRLRDARRYI